MRFKPLGRAVAWVILAAYFAAGVVIALDLFVWRP